jgi:hypothetical protein
MHVPQLGRNQQSKLDVRLLRNALQFLFVWKLGGVAYAGSRVSKMANRGFRITTPPICPSCLHGKNIYEEDADHLATLAYLHTRLGPLKLGCG